MKTTLIVLGGALLAGTLLAAPSAHAAKPLDAKQKLELSRDMANNAKAKAKFKSPPKANARMARKIEADGSEVSDLPEDTYNYLGAVQDAKGVMHVRDVNPDAPVAKVEVLDEK
jgi:hypothetical protein